MEPQCRGSRWAPHTGNYSTRRKLLTPEEWDEEMKTRGVATGHSNAQMCCQGSFDLSSQQQPQQDTAAAGVGANLRPSPSSQGLRWAHKDSLLGGRSKSRTSITPLSSMSWGRRQSSYENTLYNYLKGGCSEVG